MSYPFKKIAVYCGSNSGKVGMMGRIADGLLYRGGTVIGVMPQALVDQEIAHQGLSELPICTKEKP